MLMQVLIKVTQVATADALYVPLPILDAALAQAGQRGMQPRATPAEGNCLVGALLRQPPRSLVACHMA
jgi:hypothetical protein